MIRFIQYLLIFLITLCLPFVSTCGPNKDLKCQDWLVGANPRYDEGINRVVTDDAIGIKGVCKDFYPTWGERFKFERTNSDFFKASYEVKRQYCWARNVFWGGGFQSNMKSGKTYCGGCRMNFIVCKGDGWTPPKYTSWGETYSAKFGFGEVSAGTNGWSVKKPMKKGGLAYYNVCLRRYITGEKFLHDPDGTPHSSFQPKVCAYIVNIDSCNSPLLNWGHALIGCVDEPVAPGPGVFNHILIGQSIAYVDEGMTLTDYLGLGSTFDQPVVQLTNGLDGADGNTLDLRYKFPNDTRQIDSKPVCGVFPDGNNVEYCAQFDSSRPNSICACVKEECSSNIYIGCAPRPNLEQSKLKIKTEYRLYEDEEGEVAPALGVQIVEVDGSGTEIQPLSLTKDPLFLREYYRQILDPDNILVQRDTIEVYGVKLAAMIPKFVDDEPEYIRVATPAVMQGIDNCYRFAKFPIDDNRWPKYFVPAGNRNRDNCVCPIDIENTFWCTIPPAQQCLNSSQLIPHEDEAVDAYCPGYYTGFEDVSTPDKICVENDTDFDFITQVDGLCAEFNTSCAVSTYSSPSSGNALFPSLELERDTFEEGVCDDATGYEYALDYSVNIDFSNVPQNVTGELLRKQFEDSFKALADLYNSYNMNIPAQEIEVLERVYGGVIKVGEPVLLKPVHRCSGNGLSGVIENGCRLKEGCPSITKPSYTFFGSVFIFNGSVNEPVAGACAAPFVADDGIPNMKCTELIDESIIPDYKLSIRYWNRSTFVNACQSPQRENTSSNSSNNPGGNNPNSGNNSALQ